MTKKRAKLSVFILLSLIGLTTGFFFAGYLNLLFSGGGMGDLSAIQPAKLLTGVITDERQRMLTLCIMVVIETGIAAFVLLSRKETYESDTSDITKGIKTPIAIGQGQHGTARWMTSAEKHAAFAMYRLDKRDRFYADLLRAGRKEAKDVMSYTEKPEDGADGTVETPVGKKEAAEAQEN